MGKSAATNSESIYYASFAFAKHNAISPYRRIASDWLTAVTQATPALPDVAPSAAIAEAGPQIVEPIVFARPAPEPIRPAVIHPAAQPKTIDHLGGLGCRR